MRPDWHGNCISSCSDGKSREAGAHRYRFNTEQIDK